MNWEGIYGRPATDHEGFFLETFRDMFPSSRRLLVYPRIPPDVLAEARRSYLLEWDEGAPDEWLVAMVDPSLHGGGLHLGLALTTRALYWRNVGQAPGAVRFEHLPAPEVRGTWLDFGAAGSVDVQYLDTGTIDTLVRFLEIVVAAWRDGVPAEFVRGWVVRHEAAERGPYTERELVALLRSGALMPYTSEARGPGMADWAPMPQIDLVAEVLAEMKAVEAPPAPTREAFARVAGSKPTGPIRTRPAARTPPKQESRSVGQVIDGLIDSVLKRLKG